MATIAIVAPGAMGSAIARHLIAQGARVLTSVEGRSDLTVRRARDAGMVAVAMHDLATADLILSIVPPGEALSVAEALASVLRQSLSKPVFIDFNAINPSTMQMVSTVLAGTGCEVLDGAIIGPPPVSGRQGPTFYISGDLRHRSDILLRLGLNLRLIDAPSGAASALKMVYAGVNKGITALGTAMLLASADAGCAQGLRQEMGESLPDILAHFTRSIPDMYPKAYRWVAEMREIAAFLGADNPAAGLFEAAAQVFARVAEDDVACGELASRLNNVLGLPE
ncbi:NAD(P)-dependent oxidoreductase [Novacetimonas pomaceti]|uniref:6-phosphogluconate dehydrogenase n=1 Tax=Novacetimonas pomaceti TaxID=2021998 RepID=A0ABX5P6R4_9PROT|nr:NAD(P)-dependent oxidoreductase [Novacetimonas pomaceti]PYD48597.1 6-phosphogluconate dehydrogenase [Novacetimonas pomaceti]